MKEAGITFNPKFEAKYQLADREDTFEDTVKVTTAAQPHPPPCLRSTAPYIDILPPHPHHLSRPLVLSEGS